MFNLIDDPWISVLTKDGEKKLGLLDIFKEADSIKAISGNALDKIAITRLLVCISQAAIGVPKNKSEWEKCKSKIQKISTVYLKKWHDSFFLYGNKAFLQLPKMNIKTILTDKIIIEYASGNNHTVYDHNAGISRNYPESDLAMALLKTQLFSYGGRNGSVWDVQKSNSMSGALLNSTLVTLLLGEDILSTIHLNMATMEIMEGIPVGKPVWEDIPNDPKCPKADILKKSYLGNLIPLTRGIKLMSENKSLVMYSDGISGYCPLYRDPMASTYTDKKGGRHYRSVPLTKHVWKDLVSILSIKDIGDGQGAYTLNNIDISTPNFNLWVGGIACDKSKIKDIVEWSYIIPSGCLESDQLRDYQVEIDYASDVEKALRESLYEMGENKKSELISTFWNQIENFSFGLFQKIIECHANKNNNSDAWRDSWRRRCRAISINCFKNSYQTQTGGGIMNYAKGLRVLSKKLNKIGGKNDN